MDSMLSYILSKVISVVRVICMFDIFCVMVFNYVFGYVSFRDFRRISMFAQYIDRSEVTWRAIQTNPPFLHMHFISTPTFGLSLVDHSETDSISTLGYLLGTMDLLIPSAIMSYWIALVPKGCCSTENRCLIKWYDLNQNLPIAVYTDKAWMKFPYASLEVTARVSNALVYHYSLGTFNALITRGKYGSKSIRKAIGKWLRGLLFSVMLCELHRRHYARPLLCRITI